MELRKFAGTLFIGNSILLYLGFLLLKNDQYIKFGIPITFIILATSFMVLSVAMVTNHLHPQIIKWINTISDILGVRQIQLGLIVFTIPLAIMAWISAGNSDKMLNPWMAITAWCCGIIFAVLAGWKNDVRINLPSRKLLLALFAIFSIAFFVRIVFPNSIPIFLSGDEGGSGQAAALFASGAANNIFKVFWFSFPSFYFAIPGLLINFFGQNVFALRLSSAIPGALTVLCTFWILKTAYGDRTAWVGAIFLSFLHFHVHFSRIALNNIWDGFWFTLTIGAIWYAWTHERRNAYLLAGLSLGLSQYFYSSGRILILVLGIWLLVVGIHDRARLKRALPDLGFFCLVAATVMLPLVLFYIQFPNELSAPFNRVSILNEWLPAVALDRGLPVWRILLEQFAIGFGAYVFAPIRHWYAPGTPILLPMPAAFFMIGLIFLFFNRQKKLNLLLILWLSAFAVIGALSESTPASQRYTASAPAAAMLVAIGVTESARLLEEIWPRFEKLIKNGVIVVVVLLACSEIAFYFFTYTPKSSIELGHSNSMIGYQMGLYLRNRKDHPQIIFIGAPSMGFKSIPSTQYLAPKFNDGITIDYPWGDERNPSVEGDHLLFIILPLLENDLAAIRKEYPNGKLSTELSTDYQPLFYVYEYKDSP